MHRNLGSVGAVYASNSQFARIRRKRLRSLYTVFPTLLLGLVLIASVHAGIATAPSPLTDYMAGPQSVPDSGDAPNSSVCRHALKQSITHSDKCNTVRDTTGCRFDSGFIPYLEFQYCLFPTTAVPTILMVVWLFIMLGAFAVIADSFFSPSLIALARSMHMSQNLAGVTLLAFGNGAPDVFSAVTAITTGNPDSPDEGLGLGFLMGSGLLVNTVTAGLIMVIRPFRTTRRPFIKDVLFYMIAVSWSASIIIRRTIYLKDSVGFIMLYIIYVLTTWAASHIRAKKSNTLFYRRCAAFLRNLKNKLNCRRTISSSTSATDNETRLSVPKSSWWKRFKSFFRSKHAVISTDSVEDAVTTSKNQIGDQPDERDVKITGFRQKQDPTRISKGPTNRNGGHLSNSTKSVPRIEVTGPSTEIGTIGQSSSTSRPPNQTPNRVTLAPPKESYVPSHHLHPYHYPHATQSPLTGGLTPPVGVSSSAAGGSHSITTGSSSFRKRASVGGIGRRSRNSSFYQSRRSRRTSTIDQLPFVVRWIIANEEAENEEELRNGHPEIRRLYRHTSDVTRADDVTFSQDASQTHSPAVSFFDKHSPRSLHHSPHGHHHYHHQSNFDNRKLGLQRISSVSLPALDEIDKNEPYIHFKLSTDTNSGISFAPKAAEQEPEVRILDKVKEQRVEEDEEKSQDEEEGDEEKSEYTDPFVNWASKVEISKWHELSTPVKIIQIIQSPIFLLFTLTIPVVYEDLEPTPSPVRENEIQMFGDEEGDGSIESRAVTPGDEKGDIEEGVDADASHNPSSRVATATNEETSGYIDFSHVDIEDLHGWCRLLNCFQCLITPMLWVLLITVGGLPLGLYKVGNSNLPIVVIVLLVSTCIAIAIFVTSRWDRAPVPYHRPFFAVLGFLTSIVWIYAIAHELVNSLEALGIVWEISEAILGITVMAFANSIGDLMSNSLLAHNGYPRIAFAACIGSPLFNLLVGSGVSYTIKLARSDDHTANMSFTLTHALLFSFLLFVLLMNLIVAFVTGFKMNRWYGITLLTIYAFFMLLAILIEADIIVPPKSWNLLTGTE
ncbi:hypothetical protein Aperf_G00000126061 [Anoplocephala perfoliata]